MSVIRAPRDFLKSVSIVNHIYQENLIMYRDTDITKLCAKYLEEHDMKLPRKAQLEKVLAIIVANNDLESRDFIQVQEALIDESQQTQFGFSQENHVCYAPVTRDKEGNEVIVWHHLGAYKNQVQASVRQAAVAEGIPSQCLDSVLAHYKYRIVKLECKRVS